MNKDAINNISQKKWYIQGFNSCLNYISHGPYSGLIGCHKNLGYGYTEMLLIFNKDYLEYHYLEDDLKKIGEIFIEKYQRNKNYFKQVLKKDIKLKKRWMKQINSVKNTDLAKLDQESAVALYQRIWQAYSEIIGVGHIIEGISFVLEPLLKENLEKALGFERHSLEFRNVFNGLFQPSKPSFASAEHVDLLEILKMIEENKKSARSLRKDSPAIFFKRLDTKIKEKILAHARKYFYNQINYFYGESLKPIDYVKELRQMIGKDISGFLKEEKIKYQRNNILRKKTIKKYKIDKDIVDLLNLSLDILHWQDTRKMVILSCVYYMNFGLGAIAKQFKIPLSMLKRYSPEEMTFKNLKRFDKKSAQQRMDRYAVYFIRKNNKIITKIYSGEECQQFIKIYYDERGSPRTTKSHMASERSRNKGFNTLYKKRLMERKDLHGTAACVGRALGVAKVCKTKKDLRDFKKGQILVASMTRPEFVPSMRNALAIITDEGGLTCHAAIVSRELGIPCIIGTKIATEVLKDGDLVEVNANHGVVTVLKRK